MANALAFALFREFPDPADESRSPDGSRRIQALLNIYPNSSTLHFLLARTNQTLDVDGGILRVSPPRLRFYTALEHLFTGKPEVGIQTIETIYQAAVNGESTPFAELRQSAVALFNAYLEDRQHLKACKMVVSSYIRAPILALSLQLSRLSDALRDSPLAGGNGEIYLPILASHSRDDFVIYKALDRFLRAHNCRRMTDILDARDHFEQDAFFILIGEVMSEDVMALGWRYVNDYSDVELQRIALCAALVASASRDASLYGEEAKAITKRRTVRSALKQIGASKMRLDVARMKKQFERAESDFQRRQTFLLAEASGKLAQIGADRLVKETSLSDEAQGETRPQFAAELSHESDNILDTLLAHCYAIYLWDSDCSLNFVLSADVRHGFLKNHLRKPFQHHNIILSKSSADGDYRINDFLAGSLKDNISEDAFDELKGAFKDFSVEIDDLIANLKNTILQVRISPDRKSVV